MVDSSEESQFTSDVLAVRGGRGGGGPSYSSEFRMEAKKASSSLSRMGPGSCASCERELVREADGLELL
ncbi:hypothetical protein HYQ46_007253 [Verticillium longisporum]|nr:hypothetical protein HYQ46_007253 [Verticillium longisporum]